MQRKDGVAVVVDVVECHRRPMVRHVLESFHCCRNITGRHFRWVILSHFVCKSLVCKARDREVEHIWNSQTLQVTGITYPITDLDLIAIGFSLNMLHEYVMIFSRRAHE